MTTNNITRYADILSALGSPTRLTVIRLLVKKHPKGMITGELQARLKISSSKLLDHLEKLKQQGLIHIKPDSENVRYTVDTSILEDLLGFFYAELCIKKQVVDWDNIRQKKAEWLEDSIYAELADPDNLEHLIPSSIYDRLGGKALQTLLLARVEAVRLQHNFIGTEQILLGLIREGSGEAAKALRSWGLELETAREEVHKIIGKGRGSGEEIPFTPKAQEVLHYSLEEAIAAGQIIISTEHLLLGLIREWQNAKRQGDSPSVASLLLSQLPIPPQKMLQILRNG